MTDLQQAILDHITSWLVHIPATLDHWPRQDFEDNGIPSFEIARGVIGPGADPRTRKAYSRALEILDDGGYLLRVNAGGRTTNIKLRPKGLQAAGIDVIPEADQRKVFKALRGTEWWPKRWKPARTKRGRAPRATAAPAPAPADPTAVVDLADDVPQASDQAAGEVQYVALPENTLFSCENGPEHGREPAAQAPEGPQEAAS